MFTRISCTCMVWVMTMLIPTCHANTSPVSTHDISDQRIQETATEISSQARTSRIIWRATESVSIAVLCAGIYCYRVYNTTDNDILHDNSTCSKTESDASDKDASMLAQRVNALEHQLPHINTSDNSAQYDSYISITYLVDKLKQLSYGICNNLILSYIWGVQNIAAKSIATIALPAHVYRMLVRPIYLSDIAHFVHNTTQIYQNSNRLLHFAQHDFQRFQYIRNEIVRNIVYDAEDIVAFLNCAQSYVDPSIQDCIATTEHDMRSIIHNFVIEIYADDHIAASQALRKLRDGIDLVINQYQSHLQQQPFTSWATTL